MTADRLYADAEPWTEDSNGKAVAPTRHRVAFGREGEHGFTFDPRHWCRRI